MSTIEPPLPPCRVENRFTASRQLTIVPSDVDRQDSLDPVDRQLVDPRLRAGDAGVRDQGGERPHRVGGREGGEHVGLDRVVGPHRAGRAAGGLDLPDDRGSGCRVGAVGEADDPSRHRGGPRHGGTDPATPSRDECDPAIHRLTVTNRVR